MKQKPRAQARLHGEILMIGCTGKKTIRIALASIALALGIQALQAQEQANKQKPANIDLTVVKPETVGFSSERLERLHALMQEAVDKKYQAGMVTILARHGKVVDYRAY